MAQVVLIEDSQVLNELISVNLVNFLGIDLINRKNAKAVVSLLEILPEIDLIICQYEGQNELTASIIQKYIIEHHLDIGLLILGGPGLLDNDFTVTILNPKNWEKVIEYSAKIMGITQEIIEKRILPDYVPVPVNYFLNLITVNCDVFIRIKKTSTDFQFVKRIHNGDAFSREVINRYKEQGLDHFYIPKEQRKDFTTFLSNVLVEKLESNHLEFAEKLEIMGEAYSIAAKEILNLGFTREIVQLTDSIIQSMIKNIEQSPEMTNLLHKIINSQSPLIFQRCHMTSVIASECLKNLDLNTTENILDITFSAFFNDILLVDTPDYTKINSLSETEEANLVEIDQDLVLKHALKTSILIGQYPNIPNGVEKIIKEHHGMIGGIGFSVNIDHLSTISKVFIISHEFVLNLIKYRENKTEKSFQRPLSEDLYRKFTSPSCAKIIKALEKSLVKNKKQNAK